jgi:hypothetical protein
MFTVQIVPAKLDVVEGGIIDLECNPNKNVRSPVFTWYKNNKHIYSAKRLRLTDVTKEQAGSYKCTARTERYMAESAALVVVSFRLGFSTYPVDSIEKTSREPVLNFENILYILPLHPELVNKVNSVTIVAIDPNNPERELSRTTQQLQSINTAEGKIFSSQPFVFPKEFKVQINGKVAARHQFEHTSRRVFKAQHGDFCKY